MILKNFRQVPSNQNELQANNKNIQQDPRTRSMSFSGSKWNNNSKVTENLMEEIKNLK